MEKERKLKIGVIGCGAISLILVILVQVAGPQIREKFRKAA